MLKEHLNKTLYKNTVFAIFTEIILYVSYRYLFYNIYVLINIVQLYHEQSTPSMYTFKLIIKVQFYVWLAHTTPFE